MRFVADSSSGKESWHKASLYGVLERLSRCVLRTPYKATYNDRSWTWMLLLARRVSFGKAVEAPGPWWQKKAAVLHVICCGRL